MRCTGSSHRFSGRFAAVAAAAMLSVNAVQAQQGGGLAFTDVASEEMTMNGILTESLAWGDYDGDGDEDLYMTNNGLNALFRNDGGDVFTDVTMPTGVDSPLFSTGTAFGDLDNDGDLDIYVVNINAGFDVLYRNDGPLAHGGETLFTDVTVQAGIIELASGRGVTFLDFDRDGRLDIYVMANNTVNPANNIFYHNLGALEFEDIADFLGVEAPSVNVGVVATDIDDNGWVDLFVGNRNFDINAVFMNEGSVFTNTSPANGVTDVSLGMGVLSFDYDNDRDFDLYYTSWPNPPSLDPNRLYENIDGLGNFVEVGVASGTDDPMGWGISCNIGDIDNDGWQDFYVTNGFSTTSSPNVLFHNQQDSTFADVTSFVGGGAFDGRGAAFADYDQDGDTDLAVTGQASNQLWRNDSTFGNHSLTLRLRGVTSNRNAIGAKLEVTAGALRTIHEVSGGAGRGSFNSLPVEVGLGAETSVDRVVIRWPDGSLQVLDNIAADQLLDVVEQDQWFDRGQAKGGTGGLRPRLVGLGPLSAGSALSLDLIDGLPGAQAFMVIGITVINAPFKGGTMVPDPLVISSLGALPASGALSLGFAWPAGIPVGAAIDIQYWLQDPGASLGFSSSNGVAAIGQ